MKARDIASLARLARLRVARDQQALARILAEIQARQRKIQTLREAGLSLGGDCTDLIDWQNLSRWQGWAEAERARLLAEIAALEKDRDAAAKVLSRSNGELEAIEGLAASADQADRQAQERLAERVGALSIGPHRAGLLEAPSSGQAGNRDHARPKRV